MIINCTYENIFVERCKYPMTLQDQSLIIDLKEIIHRNVTQNIKKLNKVNDLKGGVV